MQSGQTRKAYGICVRPVINPKESGIDNIVSGSSKIYLAYSNGAIHILGNVQDGSLDLYDLSGRLIFSDNVVDNICRLPTLSSGIYIATFSCSGTWKNRSRLGQCAGADWDTFDAAKLMIFSETVAF